MNWNKFDEAGPPVPTKEQLRETSIREARKKAETVFTLFKRKSR